MIDPSATGAPAVLEAPELRLGARTSPLAARPVAVASGPFISRPLITVSRGAPGASTQKKKTRKQASVHEEFLSSGAEDSLEESPWEARDEEKALPAAESADTSDTSDVALLGQQLASGLWAGSGPGETSVREARATALALLELSRQGITGGHALHGAQVKKAVEALLALLPLLSGAPKVAELALGVAWLVSAGPRTRGRISQAARPFTGLQPWLADEGALRQHLDALAAR